MEGEESVVAGRTRAKAHKFAMNVTGPSTESLALNLAWLVQQWQQTPHQRWRQQRYLH